MFDEVQKPLYIPRYGLRKKVGEQIIIDKKSGKEEQLSKASLTKCGICWLKESFISTSYDEISSRWHAWEYISKINDKDPVIWDERRKFNNKSEEILQL